MNSQHVILRIFLFNIPIPVADKNDKGLYSPGPGITSFFKSFGLPRKTGPLLVKVELSYIYSPGPILLLFKGIYEFARISFIL